MSPHLLKIVTRLAYIRCKITWWPACKGVRVLARIVRASVPLKDPWEGSFTCFNSHIYQFAPAFTEDYTISILKFSFDTLFLPAITHLLSIIFIIYFHYSSAFSTWFTSLFLYFTATFHAQIPAIFAFYLLIFQLQILGLNTKLPINFTFYKQIWRGISRWMLLGFNFISTFINHFIYALFTNSRGAFTS